MWNQDVVYRRRRRTFTVSVAVALLLIIIIASTGGGGPPPLRSHLPASAPIPQSPVPLAPQAVTKLPAPIRQSVAAVIPDSSDFDVMGGLATDGSSAGIAMVDPITGPTLVGTLHQSVNAAAAVDLNHQEYIIGGESGQTPQSTIWDYSAAGSGQVNQRGTLTDASYGIGAAVIGNSVYIVGGYTGAANLKTIFAWTPGSPPTLVGKLPVGLRYAAVAAIDNELIIAGGATATGVSKQVYVFNPANKSVHAIAQLPTGLEWAAAATLGDLVYVIGGEPGSGKTPVTTIYSIDPIGKQHVANAGTLPSPLAEAAMVKVGSTIYLSGGWNGTAAVTTVLALTAKAS